MNPQQHPNTYFVQDQSNQEEITRLRLQDVMVTQVMSGVFSEQPDPTHFRKVLDVGCGTGGWLFQVAQTYPHITYLVGVDISAMMVNEARAQAQMQGLSQRVEFHMMDAQRMLEFPDHTFDLVNQRLGASYLRQWEWDLQIHSYQRVARHGGTIRITECNVPESNSSALNELNRLLLNAASQAGYLFINADGNSVMNHLPILLEKHGIQAVQTHRYCANFRMNTPEGQGFIKDETILFRTALPFLHKWIRVPSTYEQIYQQALIDMQDPGFRATWTFCTVWGIAS